MEKIKRNKYKILIMIVLVIIGIIGINKIGKIDKEAGKINISKAYVNKVSASISEANISNNEKIGSTEKIEYEIRYKIDGEEKRNVEINASLTEEEAKYARFEKVEEKLVTSTLNEEAREITIKIEEVEPNKEQKLKLVIMVKGAPDGYKVSPRVEIKEETSEEYERIKVQEAEVETRSITGIIRDETKNGVANIEVKLENNEGEEIKRTYTDDDGRYTFSDLEIGKYYINVVEDRFEITSGNEIEIEESTVLDIEIKETEPFKINIKKYIRNVTINGKTYTYGEMERVNQVIKNLKEIEGEIEYKVVIRNEGKKEGVITRVEEEIAEGLGFKENNGWKEKQGKIRNEEVEGISLKPGKEKEIKLVLQIEKTTEAKSYLSRVTAKGEIYERISYVVDNEVYKEEEVLEGEKIEEKVMPDKNGVKFSGWYTDKNYTNKYNFNNEVTKDIILYGKYEEKIKNIYNVIFIDEGKVIETKEYEEGSLIVEPILKEKEGHTFIGWYEEGEESSYDLLLPVTRDITLYSKYDINKYTVKFFDKDYEIKEFEQEVEYNNKAKEPEMDPTLEDYIFLGWVIRGTDIAYVFGTPVKENIELEAKFTKKELHKVTFVIDNEIIDEINVIDGKTVNKPDSDPLKEGYTFDKWYKDKELTAEYDFEEKITEDKIIYGKYNINKYQITFINYDGNILQTEELEYGSMPEYKGETPEKEKTQEYTYTFAGWTPEIEEVKTNQVYKAEYSETKNKYTVTFMDGEELYRAETVNYGEIVEALDVDPSKEYYIFRGWVKEDGSAYDFNTPVIEDIILYSSYEEVNSPEIVHTPIEWTNENVKVTITSEEKAGIKYKIDEGEYQEYTGEFEVSENCSVVAKTIKEEVESKVTIHEITNIDKIKPEIKEIEEGNITASSIEITTKLQDNESGLKEVKIYSNNELVATYPYNENTTEEKQITYTINNLEELTTYRIKIEAIDYAGNISISEEKEIKTIEKDIVAKIIGRNNILNSELIEEAKKAKQEEKGEELTEEEIKEIEERYQDERYESLEEAINACDDGQCTIQMVKSTTESVEILDTQDITLDINGTTITGIRDYTILNIGNLIIKDSGEIAGSIYNPNEVAINNIEGSTLTLGEDEDPQEVSTEKPNIIGKEKGIENKGILNFFDGRIEGTKVAIDGEVTKTPYLYNARVTSAEKQVATLTILAEAEARMNSTYYTKIANAMSESKKGSYEEKTITTSDLKDLIESDKDSLYYFEYNEEDSTLTNNNQGLSNTTANSYIKIDLSDYTENQILTINAKISSLSSNAIGYATITNTEEVPAYDNTAGRFIYISGEVESQDYLTTLEAGKIYYLHLGYRKGSYSNAGADTFTINSIKLETQYNTENYVTPGLYGFKYNEETGVYTSANGIANTTANSYIVVDLTNEIEDKTITIDAYQTYSYSGGDKGYVTITDSAEVPAYSNTAGRVIYLGSSKSQIITTTLKAGQVNYIHLGYRLDSSLSSSSTKGRFIINSIKYEDGTNILEQGNITKTEYTQVNQIPVLNKEVDTIELLRTITLAESLEVEETRDVILDLRGQTLTTSSTDYVIKNNGSLKIIDSKYTGDIEQAQIDYENELAENKLNYEIALENYNAYKEEQQSIYDTTYISEVEAAKNKIADTKLTSNTSYGEVISDSGENPYKVFDGDKTTTWKNTTENSGYIQWNLPEEKTITSFKIYGSEDTSKYPKMVELFGSKDGEEYVSLVSNVLESKGLNEYNEIQIDSSKYDSYKYFKWNFTNEGNAIEIGEIELEIYDIVREVFNDVIKVDPNTSNFTYDAQNKSNSSMSNSGDKLLIQTYGSGNTSVTYYTKKIVVPDGGQKYIVKGNLGLRQSSNNGTSSGTAYIGFSKTNEISKEDFDSYITRDINSTTEVINDFSVTIDQAGEYYFKIVMYHNTTLNNYIYANLYNLSFTMMPELKQAVLRDTTQQGNITSSAGSVILNDEGSNLVIDEVIINLNKAGTTSSYTNAITNYGTLQINKNGIINNNQNYANAIENKATGDILNSNGIINVTGSTSYGIRNYSMKNSKISGFNISLSNSNAYGISHNSNHELILDDVTIKGSGKGILMQSPNALTLENNNIRISSNAIVFDENTTGIVNINGGIIDLSTQQSNNLIDSYNSYGTININSGEFYSYNGIRVGNHAKLNMSGGYIESNDLAISVDNGGEINLTGGEVHTTNASNATIKNDGLLANISGDFKISCIDRNTAIYNSGSGTMNIGDNVEINSININSSAAISNRSSGIINISDNVVVNSINSDQSVIVNNGSGTINVKNNVVVNSIDSITTGLRNNGTGTINIGEKDGNVSTTYPKINSNVYGIRNSDSGIVNYYDGILIAQKEKGIYGYINDSEENYDLNIKEESEELENITLAIPTIEEFGQVVRIDDTTYPSLKSAINALLDNEEKTIVLLKDVRTILANNILENKKAILDLNGKQVQMLGSNDFIVNNGSLEVTDNTAIALDDGTYVEGAGLLTSSGGKTISNSETGTLEIDKASLSTTSSSEVIENSGVLTINGKITGASLVISNIDNGEVTINNGGIIISTLGRSTGIKQTSTNKVVMNGGTITLPSSTGNIGIDTYGPVEVNNAVIDVNSSYGIYVRNTGSLLVNDSTIKISNGISALVNEGTTRIESGNLIGNNNSYAIRNTGTFIIENAVVSGNYNGYSIENTGEMKIYDGSISNSISNSNILDIYSGEIISSSNYSIPAVRNTGTLTLGIKGDTDSEGNLNVSKESPVIKRTSYFGISNTGTFNFYDGIIKGTNAISGSITEMEEGYDIITDTEDSLEVKYLDKLPIAKVLSNNKNYYSLQEAIDAAIDEDTVQILRDVTISSEIDVSENKNIILDLQHYKLTSTSELFINNNGILKIIDNIPENSSSIYDIGQIYISSGKAIENYGTFELSEGRIYADNTLPDIIINYNEMNISGGEISSIGSQDASFNVIVNETEGTLNITGGTLYKEYSGSIIYNKNEFTMSDGTLSGDVLYRGIQYLIENATTESKTIVTGGVFNSKRVGSNYGVYFLNNIGTAEVTGTIENPINIETGWGLNNSGILTMTNVIMQNMNSIHGIENSGELTINGGTYSNLYRDYNNSFVIRNSDSGNIAINNAKVTGLHNLVVNNGIGEIVINGGEVTATDTDSIAIRNTSSGTISLGIKDLNVSATEPLVQATSSAIENTSIGTINFYDGIIKGNPAISGSITETEDGYDIITDTEDNLEVKYLDKLPIAQIGEEKFNTIEEAILSDACNNKQCEIDIIRNATILKASPTIEIPADKNIIIDLNGYTINSGNESIFNNLGTLKIIDSTITLNEDGTLPDSSGTLSSASGKVINNSGTLEIEKVKLSTQTKESTIQNSGTLTLTSSEISSSYVGITNNDAGSIVMNSGSINVSSIYNSTYGIINNSSNEVIINGVTITSNCYDSSTETVGIISNSGRITINGGTITSNSPSTVRNREIQNNASSSLMLSGSIYKSLNYPTYIYNEGETYITGGEINGTINNSGTLLIESGTIDNSFNEETITNSGNATITGGTIISKVNALSNTGTMNITGGNISTTGTNSDLINNSGTLNLSNIIIDSTNNTITNTGTGNVNIDLSVTITSSNIAIKNSNSGTINIGTKDRQVSTSNPIITGNNYGIYNESTNGKVNFYDGIITGRLNQAIYGAVSEVEPGYKISSNSTDTQTSSTLAVIGTEERVAVVNGMNFTSLQAAINACTNNVETSVVLYSNITLDSNIIIPELKQVKLYLNGFTINYGEYNFIEEGSIEIIEGNQTDTLIGSIVNLIKDTLNISDISKNIVIYEMDDGSSLEANKTYRLYKNDKEEKVKEGEALGRYGIGREEEEMKTIRGRLYINGLSEGDYEVISSDGNKATFKITEEGKIYGTAKENIVKENKGIVATAVAELIITIQTGVIQGRYILLLSLVFIILTLLVIAQKRKGNYYGSKL